MVYDVHVNSLSFNKNSGVGRSSIFMPWQQQNFQFFLSQITYSRAEKEFRCITFLRDDIHTHFTMLSSTVPLRCLPHPLSILSASMSDCSLLHLFWANVPFLSSEIIIKSRGFMKRNGTFGWNPCKETQRRKNNDSCYIY